MTFDEQITELSEHDRAEVLKFKAYLDIWHSKREAMALGLDVWAHETLIDALYPEGFE
jgi:hypothetical protein